MANFSDIQVASTSERGETFEASASVDEGQYRVAMAGTADWDAKADLHNVLQQTHDSLLEERVELVVIDLRKLDFMSSSCLKAMLTWLNRVRESTFRYKIRIVSSRASYWQSRSVSALEAFAPGIVVNDVRDE